jgi:glycosyltransferase involved in cell wall biosynthesis
LGAVPGGEGATEVIAARNSPRASVLLPVYNGERYLAEAIDSVLAQTFKDFELLLLNDGSSDRSAALMESYVRRDTRCRLYSWPNRGIVATLNAGLELALSEIIVRMDADDICAPTRFEMQINFLNEHPECVVVASRVIWIDPEGMPLRVAGDLLSHDEIDAENMRGGQVLHHPAVAIRKDALTKSGGYRDGFKHAEDLDLFLRLAEIGRLANLPEVLLFYRQHLNSIGHQFPAQQRVSIHKALQEACARRGIKYREIALRQPVAREAKWKIHRKWGWWALNAKNVATARKHALRAVVRSPIRPENWRLLACALRGY